MLNNLLRIDLKMFQKCNSKTREVYGDSIGNKVSDKSTKVSRTLSQSSSEKVESEIENNGI